MRDALKTESSKGIGHQGLTFEQMLFSGAVACALAILLVVIPSLFLR